MSSTQGTTMSRADQAVSDWQAQSEHFALRVQYQQLHVEGLDKNIVSTRRAIEKNLIQREKRGGINAAWNAITSVGKKVCQMSTVFVVAVSCALCCFFVLFFVLVVAVRDDMIHISLLLCFACCAHLAICCA